MNINLYFDTEKVIPFLESNTLTNVISLIALSIIFWGLFEVRRRRHDASFGFYMILRFYIQRLKYLLSEDANNVEPYLLCQDQEIRYNHKENVKHGEMLAALSGKMLDYLSSENNQVPPSICKKKIVKWKNDMRELISRLSTLNFYYNNKFYCWEDEIKVKEWHMKTISLLNDIEGQIGKQ